MTKGLLGRKVGMTQIYDESGVVVPVTVIEAGPCRVLQVRTTERDGYEAVQLGFLDKKRPAGGQPRSTHSQARRSERGHVTAKLGSKRAKARSEAGQETIAKAECEPKRFVREFRGPAGDFVYSYTPQPQQEGDEPAAVEVTGEVGSEITVRLLEGVASVDITGTSKGRGFSGVMKRHNFSGQRASHGVKKVHRHAGGTGMSAYPSRLFKGKRMAGQYGNEKSTMRNVKVVGIDAENGLILVNGAVPGPNGGLVIVRETNKV